MTNNLRIGVIGCGAIAQKVHLRNLRSLSGVSVVALCDIDEQKIKGASQFVPSARIFGDFRQMLRSEDLDAVIISLPDALHAEVARIALQMRKHIYLEKPISLTLKDARILLEEWRHQKVSAMIGFNYRFNPLYQQLRRAVVLEGVGRLISARTVFSSKMKAFLEGKTLNENKTEVFNALAIHHIDLIRFIFGQDIETVFAFSRNNDHLAMQFQLSGGIFVQSFFSIDSVEDDRFDIYGEKGKLSIDKYSSLSVSKQGIYGKFRRIDSFFQGIRTLGDLSYFLKKMSATCNEPSYKISLKHFVDCIRFNKKCSPDILDGYHNLMVVEAAKLSVKTGRSVHISEIYQGAL